MKRALLLLLAFSGTAFAEVEQVGPFGPLNNTYNSFTIPSNSAQDLLNVDVSEGNKSIKKRKGYSTAFTLSNSTSAVHGVYNFYDSNGGDVSLFFNDRRMNVSVSGASPTVFFSTGTNSATYQCVDSAGFAYCANSSRDSIVKVNSSTYSLLSGFTSTGTMLAITPERLVQAGFSSNTNLIWFSKANDFSTWTVGGNPTDPIQFTITSPGSGIKHITYAHGRVYWFKDSSFGYIQDGGTLADWKAVTVNSFLGTLYNTSIFRDDILYFQGNDGHFYGWDGSNLVKLSKDIQATIDVTQGRTSNSWTQTSQSDFSGGLTDPQGYISSNVVSGSLMGSSFSVTESALADFTLGTSSNVDISNNSLIISTNNTNHPDYSFEVGWTTSPVSPQTSWVKVANAGFSSCLSVTARTGTWMAGSSGPTSGWSLTPTIIDGNTGSTLITGSAITYSGANCGSWVSSTITGNTAYARKYAKFKFTNSFDNSTYTSDAFIYNGNSVTFYYQMDDILFSRARIVIDDVTLGVSSVTVGTYTSKSYDTSISTQFVSVSSIGATINDFQPRITLQTSHNGTTWRELTSGVTSSTAPLTSVGNRYLRYIASFTVTGSSDALSTIDDVTVISRATGSYVSSVKNASSLSAWDAFGAEYQANEGSISFFVRSSTGVFYASATSPSWTSITSGNIPSISTNPYFQMAASFTVTAATQNPTLNSFVFNWFEGAASDKTYAIYHDNANWWSVASGTGATTNNKILKFNLIDPGWYIYDIGTGGLYIRSQSLYFGSVSAGKIYKYGSVDNDDGSAITSYWKSKDFFGSSPFVDKDYQRLSTVNKAVSNSTMTVTYTLDGNSATSYNVDLGSSSSSFVQKNINLPLGKVGRTINVKFGNSAADQPWEVFGGGVDYQSKPWTPK